MSCGERRPSHELVRLAIDAAGVLVPAGSGGRGAYACPTGDCPDRVATSRLVARSLHARPLFPPDLPARIRAAESSQIN